MWGMRSSFRTGYRLITGSRRTWRGWRRSLTTARRPGPPIVNDRSAIAQQDGSWRLSDSKILLSLSRRWTPPTRSKIYQWVSVERTCYTDHADRDCTTGMTTQSQTRLIPADDTGRARALALMAIPEFHSVWPLGC